MGNPPDVSLEIGRLVRAPRRFLIPGLVLALFDSARPSSREPGSPSPSLTTKSRHAPFGLMPSKVERAVTLNPPRTGPSRPPPLVAAENLSPRGPHRRARRGASQSVLPIRRRLRSGDGGTSGRYRAHVPHGAPASDPRRGCGRPVEWGDQAQVVIVTATLPLASLAATVERNDSGRPRPVTSIA